MKIYLSNPYGTIPGENWREYRFFLLATSLAEKGHDVVWFTSTFSHHFKIQRSDTSWELGAARTVSAAAVENAYSAVYARRGHAHCRASSSSVPRHGNLPSHASSQAA